MKCLSIRQPWAYLIMHHGKDIENRTWATTTRGRILIHASKGMTRQEYEDALDFAYLECLASGLQCEPDALLRGGIIGSVEIVDCVTRSYSPWFQGPYGFVLRDPIALPFIPFRGALGFFNVPDDVLKGVA